ncbi:hypothetical protein [Aurantiacibacter poecillastricola]|uniref:hypothetical protein n=1 Tax=Aurantiacibacter poecillastricola TaxID=3064385 RepID=UPI002740185B|nr:hypothetical protein [Aurantiacibacter sp. 219JJ12-13]MDP5261638.1 hypothetical protein [Aurantiacibacter sp. 219JJ12-13]
MVIRDRLPALLALAIPVASGVVWMALAGAPGSYILVNGASLALACLWILVGRGPHTATSRHMLAIALLLVMLTPLAVSPAMPSVTGDAVKRWFPLGALSLHTGMLATPALCVLAARNRALAVPILLAALGAAFLQPDAATGFALCAAAVGLYNATKDWKLGAVAAAGFLASINMALRGELPPQPFVERVVVDAAHPSVFLAAALALALLASFVLILKAIPFDRSKRFALAGLLFGFAMTALMTSYPTPLIGYGAAPILGFGLALGLHRIPKR